MLGGIMVVTCRALERLAHADPPAPGALAVIAAPISELGVPQRTPASADPPSPAQSASGAACEVAGSKGHSNNNSKKICSGSSLLRLFKEAFDHATQELAPEHRMAWWAAGWLVQSAEATVIRN